MGDQRTTDKGDRRQTVEKAKLPQGIGKVDVRRRRQGIAPGAPGNAKALGTEPCRHRHTQGRMARHQKGKKPRMGRF